MTIVTEGPRPIGRETIGGRNREISQKQAELAGTQSKR
jgi:hypothetical protein